MAENPAKPAAEAKLPAATHAYSFGKPEFALPDRPVKTKDGKSSMVVRVRVPLVNTGLVIETGIWARDYEDRDAGTVSTVFTVSLPRGLRPTEGDASVAATIQRFQQTVLDQYDRWSVTSNGAQTPSYTEAPRLVRSRPIEAKSKPASTAS